jgi:hypothetical protein
MIAVCANAVGTLHTLKKHLLAGNLEARGGIEPPIKVLQTFALPLGDRASELNAFYHFQWDSHSWLSSANSGGKKRTAKSGCPTKNRGG